MGKCKDCGEDLGGDATISVYREHFKVCTKRKKKDVIDDEEQKKDT
jgi:hypothetical protein